MIRTIALPPEIEAGCAAGESPQLSDVGFAWVVHPEEYDPSAITEEDVARDNALRRLHMWEAEAIPAVRYPSAEDLDSGEVSDTSWRCRLYLVPAQETSHGLPEVEIFAGVGNIGIPMPAFNKRWVFVGEYRQRFVGASVLDALRGAEDQLVALSEAYRGSEWDGHNRVGRWDPHSALCSFTVDLDECDRYWDADDWFGPAAIGWEELCHEASVAPERALLYPDIEGLCDDIARAVEPLQDAEVRGTAAYAMRAAERWLEDRRDDETRESR